MTNFISQYRAVFEDVSRPLKRADGINKKEIETAQKRLGHKLPKALFDFYHVAGNANYFGNFSDLRTLNELGIAEGKLIFLGDIYGTVWFGLDLPITSEDPLVIFSEGYSACGPCSLFLAAELYAEAAQGSMPFTAEATIDETTLKKIKSRWELAIELGHWQVYKQPGCIIFLWHSEKDKWEMRVGVMKRDDLEAIAHELDIELKETEN